MIGFNRAAIAGGSAAALGVGAAVLMGSAVASADADPADQSDPPARRSAAAGPAVSAPGLAPRGSAARAAGDRPAPKAGSPGPAATVAVAETGAGTAGVGARAVTAGDRVRLVVPALRTWSSSAAAGAGNLVSAARPSPAAVAAMASPAAAVSVVSGPLAAMASADRPRPAPLEGLVAVVFAGFNVALALGREFSIGINWGPPRPALILNGYELVPSSAVTVTSFYGRWMSPPGGPSMVQGRQQFNVVDPVGGDVVGTFDALVSRAQAFNYTELLVTANDGTNVGTAAGQVPPVGSLIAECTAGPFGWAYVAMPSPSGGVVAFTVLTPFGDITLPMRYNAAEGIADHTVDNRPVVLGNGYSIAPARPAGETFTATSGILPIFSSLQGYQTFSVYDSAGNPVGDFEGVFTTTSDVILNYTQAILVTANDGINVGTGAGQIPPVGSVYNVIYGGNDSSYVLYSSLPSPSGDVVSVIQARKGKVSNISTRILTRLDASTPPLNPPLSMPGGNSFVPVSDLLPVGVNGLPPREVEIQGYQRFDVYDANGIRIGTVDADVANQWDLFGIYSGSLLITTVIDGTAGSQPGQVPPTGSVYEFVYFGRSGFGTAYSVIPSSCDEISFKLLTPFGAIPFPSRYNAIDGLSGASYLDPLVTSPQVNA